MIRQIGSDNAEELDAIRCVWWQIPMVFVEGLIRSMRRRCQAVVAALGWHTRYRRLALRTRKNGENKHLINCLFL